MAVLNRKRNLLATMDHEGLAGIAGEEQRLLGVLQDCLARRQALLSRAGAAGLPSGSIQALTQAMPSPKREPLSRQVATASSRARLLHTQNLTNWIVIQRTLIHLSQLLEIIATGGRLQATYGRGRAGQCPRITTESGSVKPRRVARKSRPALGARLSRPIAHWRGTKAEAPAQTDAEIARSDGWQIS